MKRWKRYIVLAVLWALLLAVLYKFGLITTDIHKLKAVIKQDMYSMMALFIFMSFARIAVLLPDTIFMVLGGICFGPVLGFILSMIAFIFTEAVIYIIGRYIAGNWLKNYLGSKYKNVFQLLKRYGYEFLALGILCPVLPSDLICFGAAVLGYEFKKYIITTTISNIPMLLLYSFIGEGLGSSAIYNLMLILIVVLIANYTVMMFKKLREESKAFDTV
ncbi:MAG: VTT domain-containing protein [Bacillota bacterium]|nr:VTT domain-containing protein [Bacillota bacterium]